GKPINGTWAIAAQCEDETRIRKNFLSALAVFESYVGALGKLAADDPASFEQEVAKCQASLLTATDSRGQALFENATGKDKANAYFALGKALGGVLLQAYQKKAIQEYLTATHADMDAYLAAFSDLLTYYRNAQLDREAQAATNFQGKYKKNLTKVTKADSATGAFFTTIASSEQSVFEADMRQRLDDLQAVGDILATARGTLNTLYENRNNLDSEFIKGMVSLYYAEIADAMKTLSQ
ncbi:MAG: hypothetical protein AB7D57_13720, partial [Desulfovibrionaceae bacterium]